MPQKPNASFYKLGHEDWGGTTSTKAMGGAISKHKRFNYAKDDIMR